MSGTTPSRPRLTRRPDGATLVIAVILPAVAAQIWIDAARLTQVGGYAGVGPADVPRWFALGLAGLSLWSAIEAFAAPSPRPAPQNVGPILWIVAGLAAQLALLTTAGFSIVTGVLFAAAARAFGRRNLLLTVPLGIAFSLAIYLVFAGLPKLSLPAGPLERTVWALTGGA